MNILLVPRALFAVVLGLVLFATPPVAPADQGECGQPISTGKGPVTGDALLVLKVAVSVAACSDNQGDDDAQGDQDQDCECDVDNSGAVTVADALIVLNTAVGRQTHLECRETCTPTGSTTSTTQDDNEGDGSTTTSTLELEDDSD